MTRSRRLSAPLAKSTHSPKRHHPATPASPHSGRAHDAPTDTGRGAALYPGACGFPSFLKKKKSKAKQNKTKQGLLASYTLSSLGCLSFQFLPFHLCLLWLLIPQPEISQFQSLLSTQTGLRKETYLPKIPGHFLFKNLLQVWMIVLFVVLVKIYFYHVFVFAGVYVCTRVQCP